jgi:hypothetical protein
LNGLIQDKNDKITLEKNVPEQTSEKQIYVHLVCVAQAASVAPLEYLK